MTASRFRIFATALPYGAGPPRPESPPPIAELEPELPIIVRDPVLDAVSRILDSESDASESVQRSFDRKERELRAFFDQLEHDERAVAWSRLTAGDVADALVVKLARLSTERRQRIVASLAEAPRRRAR